MEEFNLTELNTTELKEVYFKIKKLMSIKREEFYELDMKLGCLIATIDIELNKKQCITCDEQSDLITTYIRPASSTVATVDTASSTVAEPVAEPVTEPVTEPVAPVETPVVEETVVE